MITILTEHRAYRFPSVEEWARDDRGDVHVYDGRETVASFNSDRFVAALQSDDIEQHGKMAEEHVAAADDVFGSDGQPYDNNNEQPQ